MCVGGEFTVYTPYSFRPRDDLAASYMDVLNASYGYYACHYIMRVILCLLRTINACHLELFLHVAVVKI